MKIHTWGIALIIGCQTAGCVSLAPVHPEPTLNYFISYARSLAYAPDGRTLVVLRGRNENVAVVLETATLSTIHLLRGKEGPRKVGKTPPGGLAFSRDGKILATAGIDDLVILWDTESWVELRRFPDTLWVTDVAFTPDGKTVVTAGPGRSARLWDVRTGAQVGELGDHQASVVAVSMPSTGQLLATGSADRTIRMWDLQTKTQTAVLDQRIAPVSSVAFSPDGTMLASSAGGLGALRWKTHESGTMPGYAAARPGWATLTELLAYGPVGLFLYPRHVTQPSTDFPCPVAISPDGKLLAAIQHARSIAGDYQVEIYDLANGSRVAEYIPGLSALAFSPDGKNLAFSGIVQVILIDPYSGKEIRKGP